MFEAMCVDFVGVVGKYTKTKCSFFMRKILTLRLYDVL